MSTDTAPRDDRIEINREFSSVGQFLNEYVSNISRSGVFIRSRNPLPIGTVVRLRFTIIDQEPQFIRGLGEVVRTSDDPQGMGVVFVELEPVSQTFIAKLLTKRPLRADTAPQDPPDFSGAGHSSGNPSDGN
jgi:uncharacterized protein (TIGR02266 family)